MFYKNPQSGNFIIQIFILFVKGIIGPCVFFALSIRLRERVLIFIGFEKKRCCTGRLNGLKFSFDKIPGLDVNPVFFGGFKCRSKT